MNPLNNFKRNNVNKCVKSKQELLTLKNVFDLSQHNCRQYIMKYNHKMNDDKIQKKLTELEAKRDIDLDKLTDQQELFIKNVNNMEKYKNNDLLQYMEMSWDCYLHFNGMLLQTIWQNTNDMNSINNQNKQKLLNGINSSYVYAEIND